MGFFFHVITPFDEKRIEEIDPCNTLFSFTNKYIPVLCSSCSKHASIAITMNKIAFFFCEDCGAELKEIYNVTKPHKKKRKTSKLLKQ